MSDVSGRWWVAPTRVASRARGVVASHDTAVMRADRVQGPLRAVLALRARLLTAAGMGPGPYCTRVGNYWRRVGGTPGRWGLRAVRTTLGQWIPTLVEYGAHKTELHARSVHMSGSEMVRAPLKWQPCIKGAIGRPRQDSGLGRRRAVASGLRVSAR